MICSPGDCFFDGVFDDFVIPLFDNVHYYIHGQCNSDTGRNKTDDLQKRIKRNKLIDTSYDCVCVQIQDYRVNAVVQIDYFNLFTRC